MWLHQLVKMQFPFMLVGFQSTYLVQIVAMNFIEGTEQCHNLHVHIHEFYFFRLKKVKKIYNKKNLMSNRHHYSRTEHI